MIYLIDLDDVLADYNGLALGRYHALHPDRLYIPPEEITTFYIKDSYPAELRPLLEEVYNEPGFFRDIPPIPGGLEAVQEIADKGHHVFICSAPLLTNPTCASDKYDWVKSHLGAEWEEKLILSRDKTLIAGDYLVDDKPSIKGCRTPSWKHILYTQPCNAHIRDKPRMKWTDYTPEEDWRKVLNL